MSLHSDFKRGALTEDALMLLVRRNSTSCASCDYAECRKGQRT